MDRADSINKTHVSPSDRPIPAFISERAKIAAVALTLLYRAERGLLIDPASWLLCYMRCDASRGVRCRNAYARRCFRRSAARPGPQRSSQAPLTARGGANREQRSFFVNVKQSLRLTTSGSTSQRPRCDNYGPARPADAVICKCPIQ